MRKIAVKPTIAFTTVSVSRMPTEKASRALRGTASLKTKTMKACSVPIPPGEIGHERGEARRHLHEQHVPDALVDPECAEEEPDREEAERPVARLPRGDGAQVALAVVQHDDALPDALLEVLDAEVQPDAAEDREDHEHEQRT